LPLKNRSATQEGQQGVIKGPRTRKNPFVKRRKAQGINPSAASEIKRCSAEGTEPKR
jgi:hypothetical protein